MKRVFEITSMILMHVLLLFNFAFAGVDYLSPAMNINTPQMKTLLDDIINMEFLYKSKIITELPNGTKFSYSDGTAITIWNSIYYDEFIKNFKEGAIDRLFVGKRGMNLLEILSNLRLDAYINDTEEVISSNIRQINGVSVKASNYSFKRHELYAQDSDYAVELKIPGDYRPKVEENNFDITTYLLKEHGHKLEGKLVEVVAKIKLPLKIYKLYGIEKKCAPLLILYKHYGGKRLNQVTPEYIKEVARNSGKKEKDIFDMIAIEPVKILRAFHEAGIRASIFNYATDMHLNNFLLTQDGQIKFVSDFGAGWKEPTLLGWRFMKKLGRKKELLTLLHFPREAFFLQYTVRARIKWITNIADFLLLRIKHEIFFLKSNLKIKFTGMLLDWELKRRLGRFSDTPIDLRLEENFKKYIELDLIEVITDDLTNEISKISAKEGFSPYKFISYMHDKLSLKDILAGAGCKSEYISLLIKKAEESYWEAEKAMSVTERATSKVMPADMDNKKLNDKQLGTISPKIVSVINLPLIEQAI